MQAMTRRILAGLVLMMTGMLWNSAAQAQRFGGAEPGQFDFYVLSLSWSPSFCESRGNSAPRMQCAGDRAYSFVVHGLWPQFERGSPEYCQVPAQEVERRTIGMMLDLMPAPGLIQHQWKKHGTCSGARSPSAFFETVRQARAAIKIPPIFERIDSYQTVTPHEITQAFVHANPGLTPDMMAIDCDQRYLREVRICLTKDLRPRACQDVQRRSCRRDRLVLPPVRSAQRI